MEDKITTQAHVWETWQGTRLSPRGKRQKWLFATCYVMGDRPSVDGPTVDGKTVADLKRSIAAMEASHVCCGSICSH